MSRRNYAHDKISDDDLRGFAESDADERLSVLIELEAKPPTVLIGERPWGERSRRPLEIEKRDHDAIARRMARLQKELASRLGETQRLEAAEAFVAEVTPAQLREISLLRDVGQIRPNRRHRAG